MGKSNRPGRRPGLNAIFHKLLLCSTAHITWEDNDELLETEVSVEDTFSFVCMDGGFLFILLTYDAKHAVEQMREDGRFSKGFEKLISYAVKRGCGYIRMDKDAPIIKSPEVELYNW